MSNIRELSQLASVINVNDETKNVGIGTSNPESKLSIAGDLTASGNITATSFYGDGSNLEGVVSGVGISSNGTLVGTGITSLDFVGVAITSVTEENGVATIRFKNNDGVNGIEVVDDISSGFNGQETTFSLNSGGALISVLNPQQLIVNLGGVVQSPGVDYTVSGSNITFTTPPQSGLTFSAVSIGVTVGINVPADGSVTRSKIAAGVLGVGIQSAGVSVGTGITTLNFIGAGNTFAVNGNTVDISISGGGGGASVSIGTEAPANPSSGDLWYSSTYGRTFIYYEDDDSSQWVDAAPFNTGANSTVIDDTSTDATFYPLFTSQTSGTVTESNVSSTKLSFNPFTGKVTATNFNATSDIKLKENIHQIKDPLEKIMQINGVAFDWKDTKEATIGVIAQDIEEVFPELVKENEHHKSVNYNGLIGVLIEAMKEQQKQIEELKNLLNK